MDTPEAEACPVPQDCKGEEMTTWWATAGVSFTDEGVDNPVRHVRIVEGDCPEVDMDEDPKIVPSGEAWE